MKKNKRNRKTVPIRKKQSKIISLWKRFLSFLKDMAAIVNFVKMFF